jgi:hypothetical protein
MRNSKGNKEEIHYPFNKPEHDLELLDLVATRFGSNTCEINIANETVNETVAIFYEGEIYIKAWAVALINLEAQIHEADEEDEEDKQENETKEQETITWH